MDDDDSLPTILVADDEPDIIALVARRLTRSGFAVVTAADGEDALRMARERRPDLVLLDVMMPRLTGLEVSRMLRAAPDTHAIPVILMSAGVYDLAIPGDADAFIAKPFQTSKLPTLVREVLALPPREVPVRPSRLTGTV